MRSHFIPEANGPVRVKDKLTKCHPSDKTSAELSIKLRGQALAESGVNQLKPFRMLPLRCVRHA